MDLNHRDISQLLDHGHLVQHDGEDDTFEYLPHKTMVDHCVATVSIRWHHQSNILWAIQGCCSKINRV